MRCGFCERTAIDACYNCGKATCAAHGRMVAEWGEHGPSAQELVEALERKEVPKADRMTWLCLTCRESHEG